MRRHALAAAFCLVFSCLFGIALWYDAAPALAVQANEAMIIDLEGPINPGTAMFVTKGMEAALDRDAKIIIIRLDTPGGLSTSMRTIIKAMLNSPIPVVVYVGPAGAGAASAGVMITVAAHVAAMAPGTNIGAAHPVTAGGKDIESTMSEKVLNDMASYARGIAEDKGRNGEWVEKAIRESVSITSDEALKLHVIDLIAKDIDELLQKLDGREVALRAGKVTLKTKDLKQFFYRPGFRDKILKTISDPNISYILMMIGLAGLYFEMSNPGAIFPGVIGAISLILAFYSFQALPVNYAGLLLIALSLVMFLAEIKITSYGILSIGGFISLILGSIMLFGDVGVSMKLLLPTVIFVGCFFVIVAALAFRAFRSRPKSGKEGLLGQTGLVRERIDPEGMIFVHGEYWRATAGESLAPGEKVEVVGMEGLVLKVRKATDQES